MATFAIVAGRSTPTNERLGCVLGPAQAVTRLRAGDVALGRLDVLLSLDGIEPGLWALDVLERRGVAVLNTRSCLEATHDKLATAEALGRAGLPHPRTAHVAPWLPPPTLEPPLVLKPRFGSWGRDVVRCDTPGDLADELELAQLRPWFDAAGGVVQELVPPVGHDLRIVVAGGLGARRVPTIPPAEACRLALAAAEAVGGDLVGIDLLPAGGGWTVLEVNGAVDFTGAYGLGSEVFSAAREALLGRARAAGPALLAG
jgi:glutathione synthase/RimK-type ligase-like ATP-grasp enzyme